MMISNTANLFIATAVLTFAVAISARAGQTSASATSVTQFLKLPGGQIAYDDTGGIGKLYARQDEIGTPFCVTVDHQSLEDEAVTVRDRDTWEQERVQVSDLPEHLLKRLTP